MQDEISKSDTAKVAFVTRFRRGYDGHKSGDDHATYGIDATYFDTISFARSGDGTKWWLNKIEVYGDEELRDRILDALIANVS